MDRSVQDLEVELELVYTYDEYDLVEPKPAPKRESDDPEIQLVYQTAAHDLADEWFEQSEEMIATIEDAVVARSTSRLRWLFLLGVSVALAACIGASTI